MNNASKKKGLLTVGLLEPPSLMPILRRVLESALGSGGVKLPVFEPVMQRTAGSGYQ
jgi:hypothetical protein